MIEAGGQAFTSRTSSLRRRSAALGGKCSCRPATSSARSSRARLASDVLDVPTVLIARTDADSARLLTSDVDPRDREFVTGERTPEGST